MTLWEISDETVLDIIVCEQNRLCSRCVYSLRQLSARGANDAVQMAWEHTGVT
jgi:hypothetical protein